MVDVALLSRNAQAGGSQSYKKALKEATQGISPFVELVFFGFFFFFLSTGNLLQHNERQA